MSPDASPQPSSSWWNFWKKSSAVPHNANSKETLVDQTAAAPSACPVDHSKWSPFAKKPNTTNDKPSECPVEHSSDQLNALNMMPRLKNERLPGQSTALPLERSLSSIPKGKSDEHSEISTEQAKNVWEYPSPQQFYNALVRKGWETPEEAVPTMVDIHNFLNEACWEEIKRWEKEYHCDCKKLSLVRFRGRPTEPTPKARFFSLFGVEKPFDRHDWTVDRCGTEVRYVIDYYGAPDEGPYPVFHVDVRPALDSPSAAFDRTRRVFSDLWSFMSSSTQKKEQEQQH